MTHPLYQTVKAALGPDPLTVVELATKLEADNDATRQALEELSRRGKASHCGHPDPVSRRWSRR